MGDADTASRRRRQVKLINAVFNGILQAIELEPYTKEQFTVWADSVIGEGLLFKSITNDIPSMVNFSIDSESDLATLGERAQCASGSIPSEHGRGSPFMARA